MYVYVICAAIWIVIMVPAIRSRLINDIYAHAALSILLTMLTLSFSGVGAPLSVRWLRWAGYGLFVPAAIVVAASLYQLRWRVCCEAFWPSRPEPGDVLDRGIYAVIRHPLFLAGALWTLAFMLVFQSTPTLILGPLGVFCFWIASRSEDQFNIQKFGAVYQGYASKVPGWDMLRNLRRLHKS